jgi:hypothetical protein
MGNRTRGSGIDSSQAVPWSLTSLLAGLLAHAGVCEGGVESATAGLAVLPMYESKGRVEDAGREYDGRGRVGGAPNRLLTPQPLA